MSFFDQPARVTRFKLVHAVWRRQRMEVLPGVAPVSLLLARTENTVVGLIAAVPLTTVLVALVATEEPPPGQAHATAGTRYAPEAERAPLATAATLQGRSAWGLARGLSREQAALVWDRVLAIHGPHLSHALVDVDSGAWLAAAELPAEAKTAASRLRQLAADAQRGASWYQRARTAGLVRLDLGRPEELELLRRYGPLTTDARVWVHGDPTPVVETGDSYGELPRFTYRLDPAELQRVQALLAEAGLTSSTLSPAGCARPGPRYA